MFSLIVAFDKNQLIGKDNMMPWHFPNDLKYFKSKTLNHKVIMGYNTYKSIVNYLGNPFPSRHNIILSESVFSHDFDNVEIVTSVGEILSKFSDLDEEIFIAGGKSVYEQLLPHCNKLYITHIDDEFEGNVYFPAIDFTNFKLVSEVLDDKLRFCVYEAINND